ncbi:MAG: radical SAM protein, partial [Tidjanibacter sp.]|nr:radical SAM protein [Tidjanibacter sp.]
MAALYIHIPFCKTRCNYCDFYKSTSCAKTEDYIEALEREMEYRRGYFGDTPVDTVFFGGGTPSLLPPALLQRLIDKARSLWNLEGVS